MREPSNGIRLAAARGVLDQVPLAGAIDRRPPDQFPHHLQLVFARVSVEWSTQRGLITGTFKTGSTSSGGRYDPYLLSVGQQIDPEVCASARKLLERSVVDAKVTAPLVQALAHASGG